MPLTTAAAAELAAMIFNNSALTLFAASETTYDLALFTASPGAGGSFADEANYTDYVRETVARTSGGWALASNLADNVNDITWTVSGGAPSNTISHVGIVGAGGVLIAYATISPQLVIGTGATPKISIGNLNWTVPTS